MFAFTFYFQGMLVCLLVICSNKYLKILVIYNNKSLFLIWYFSICYILVVGHLELCFICLLQPLSWNMWFLYLREKSIGRTTCGFCLDVAYVAFKTSQVAKSGNGSEKHNFLLCEKPSFYM